MTIRVLWLIKGLGPGGSERLLVSAAQAHDRSVIEPSCAYVLAAKDHLSHELESLGVTTTCLAPKRWNLWPLRLRRLLVGQRFDIIHIHSPVPGVVARCVVRTLPRDHRPQLVTTEHNAVGTYRLPVRIANRLTARWDDATITVSDEVLNSLRGLPRRRALSLPHGIDVAAVATMAVEPAHRLAARREFGVGDDEIVIGTVANFRLQKDYPNLLTAIQRLHQRGVQCRLIAIGQGPLEQQMRVLVTDLDLDDVVTIAGYRPDATTIMTGFDIFVLASAYEGLPVALMDALALGLAVVATAVGGVGESLTDGVDAVLVAPADPEALSSALESVVRDASLRQRLAAAAQRRAPDFDMRRAVGVIEQIYTSLIPLSVQKTEATAAQTAVVQVASAQRSRPPCGLQVREATDSDRAAMIEMMRRPLRWGDDPRITAFFEWKHDQNPFGRSPTWIALDGRRIVAVRTFMRWQFLRGGTALAAVRAVDTATDPDYQGRGLFRELTNVGVESLLDEGISFVFNTPNDQSRPGYLSMGWCEVGHLATTVIPRWSQSLKTARSRVPADRWSLDTGSEVGVGVDEWLRLGGLQRWTDHEPVGPRILYTPMSEEFVRWRYGTDLVPYRVVETGDAVAIVRARRRGHAKEMVVARTFGDDLGADVLIRRTLIAVGCNHALRLGSPHPLRGSFPMPGGGPILTWRALGDRGQPPLSNWQLSLGDVELF